MSEWQLVIKRLMDLSLALFLIICLSPVLLATAALVRITSSGPAIFRQNRLGKGGRPFPILKFRTMITGAPDLRNTDGSAFNAEDDPRLTNIGRILRKTSLDELPQLFNVLMGHMSLVGPRPDQVDQLRFYSDREKRKLCVKPGITGLAQISGRNSIPWDRRKQLDVEYVNCQSLKLDLKILAKTLPYVLFHKDVFVSTETHPRRHEQI